MLAQQMKSFLKSSLSPQVHHQFREFIKNRPKASVVRRVRQSFNQAARQATPLGDDEFDSLMKLYPFPPRYPWDKNALVERGRARSRELTKLPGADSAKHFLELGCWDGMVSGSLAGAGLQATAIDYRDIGFDSRATAMGATLLQMDASKMQFEDGSFDVVFSYDAIEHVRWPDSVLGEALRVLRPGGLVYLDFGPLYFSPLGEHAYDSIPIPYCQFLFTEAQINAYANRLSKPLIDFDHVNRWSLGQYRKLWSDLDPLAEVVFCCESRDLRHLTLIEKYPGNFRARSSLFDDFLVANIRILLKRR